MPTLSTWYIRLALVYLVIGFSLGALMLVHKGVPFEPAIMVFLSLHIEYLLIGWVVQLVIGVAYWMFPRFTPEKTGMKVRGYETAARVALVLINGGLLMTTVGYLWPRLLWMTLAGHGMEAAGVVAFVINIWPRVKPVSKP